MTRVLRNLAFYPAFYGGTAGFVLLALVLLVVNKQAFRRVVEAWSAYHRCCAELLLGLRLTIEGELPRERVLFAIKHESFFEAIDLPHLLHDPVVFAKAELLRIPLWGRVGGAYGLVPVEREQGARALRAMIAAAKRLSADGRVLAIFPEGTRIRHGAAPPLQSGFAGLYKLLGLPVVPIAIDSGLFYHRTWKRSGTITARAGDLIPAGLPRDEIEARVHAAINALNGD